MNVERKVKLGKIRSKVGGKKGRNVRREEGRKE